MNLQERLCTWENLRLAYANASRGKRGRSATAAFELYLGDNLLALQKELTEQSYQPGRYHSFYIHEPKKRLISAAPFRDRVVHHALCRVITPCFERQFIPHSYANRIRKGTHRALNACQQFARRYPYVLQCDVKQFFPSIDHAILREVLQRMLPDDSLFWLIDRILASGQDVLAEEYEMVWFPGDDLLAVSRPRGLPIGNLTSQWWANCYLNPFDHFVRRELGCKAYLRYVDDFLLFGESKEQGSSVERVNSDESRNEFWRNALQVDAKLVDSHITAQEMLADAAKWPEEVAQACPHPFDGVGMDFVHIVLVSVSRPFFATVRHG